MRRTSEFAHYQGCRYRDPDNCSGCALVTDGEDEQGRRRADLGPNYSAWPLAYMENHRTIPAKWRAAFKREMNHPDNPAYAANVRATMEREGVKFSDGLDVEGK